MIESTVADRANAAGSVGRYLEALLPSEYTRVVSTLPFDHQVSFVYRPSWRHHKPTELQRVAAAFLLPRVPVQVSYSAGSILTLLNATLPNLPPRHTYHAGWSCDSDATRKAFPLKANPAASNKVNVYLSEVCYDLRRTNPGEAMAAEAALQRVRSSGSVYNDQATAVVLYGFCLARNGLPGAYDIALALLLNPDYAKSLTGVLKATGGNATAVGSLLVEANTLLGRDVAPVDLGKEFNMRTQLRLARENMAEYPPDVLRATVRRVLLDELTRRAGSYELDYPSLEEHWDSRWAWAVNGAQGGAITDKGLESAPRPPGATREYRRSWLERVEEDPRPQWDGTTEVSASSKLEHGKTRAIFACDTVNYLAFEHLMSTVEANWRGVRVVLNPGKGGNMGMAMRVQAARRRCGVSLMLDYDDFNSHHTISAMQIVVEEVCSITGYDPDLAARLVASLDKQYITLAGRRKLSVGTLMSGHRCTTFFNSVLNAVYVRLELGEPFYSETVSLHVGDDVYMGVRDYVSAAYVIQRLADSPLRMNALKQSVGHVSTEFLRIATGARDCYGYLSRAVASIVSGNWVNDTALAPFEGLAAMVASARSLANRGKTNLAPLLLVSSVLRIAKLGKRHYGKVSSLLDGTVALGNGPQYSCGAHMRWCNPVVVRDTPDPWGYTELPLESVTAYLSRAASPLEWEVLGEAGISVTEQMAAASYRKTYASLFWRGERLTLGPTLSKAPIGSASAEDLARATKPHGLLAQYPLLLLARDRIPETLVRVALGKAGGNPHTSHLAYDAWGEYDHGCQIQTVLGYADAAAFGKRTSADVLTSRTLMYV
ncbi:putative RNA dependent RNA polymerase [Epichloe festucae virus 1]|uniref:RNA-directed RNA polymerase n=1 Tax=Epichloe festucae virus 1 TaxID=382962 RepID=Q1M2S0_9VIRU|nr:putative RNA dependent RNA polymerase [Epichloe festucae virus 1]CAK02788.1 putative RNA dependent RNA polymerase [Epichloe festucae virus 1]